MSLRLSEFIQKRQSRISALGSAEISDYVIGNDFLVKSLQSFAEVCHKIAEGFYAVRSTENESLLQSVNTEIVFKQQWNKLETRLAVMLRALETAVLFEPPENPRKKTQLFQHLKTNPQRFLRLLLYVISGEAQRKMIEELHTQARDVFFHHCEAELWRKAGLESLWERLCGNESATDVVSLGKVSENYKSFIDQNFPRDQQKLLEIKNLLKQNQGILEVADPYKRQELIRNRTQLQRILLDLLCALVFSEKFFKYERTKYSFSDAIEKGEVNCMVRSEILHQLYMYYAEEPTLAVTVTGHMYSLVKLADGRYYSLDGIPTEVQVTDRSFQVGKHERVYQAAIMNWRAIDMDNILAQEKELMYREAIRLIPTNPDYIHNLADLLIHTTSRHAEAIKLLFKAIRINPKSAWYVTSIANFYDITKQQPEALKYFLLAKQLLETDPANKSWMPLEKIEERIKVLENQT